MMDDWFGGAREEAGAVGGDAMWEQWMIGVVVPEKGRKAERFCSWDGILW